MNLLIRFLIFVIAMFLLSCSPENVERFFPATITYVQPIPLIDFPHVRLKSVKGTPEEALAAKEAVRDLNKVFASACFEIEVYIREFTETNDLNKQEIYNAFRGGVQNINLVFYTGGWFENNVTRTVGFIRASIPNTIFQNRHFVEGSFSIARNMIHEIAHLVGFNHYLVHSTSIPYQMNEIWDKCAKEQGIENQSP